MHELLTNLTSAHTVEQRLQVGTHELISASMPNVARIFHTPSFSSLNWYWPLSLCACLFLCPLSILSVHASSFAPSLFSLCMPLPLPTLYSLCACLFLCPLSILSVHASSFAPSLFSLCMPLPLPLLYSLCACTSACKHTQCLHHMEYSGTYCSSLKGHLSNEDSVCCPYHIELCTHLPLN